MYLLRLVPQFTYICSVATSCGPPPSRGLDQTAGRRVLAGARRQLWRRATDARPLRGDGAIYPLPWLPLGRSEMDGIDIERPRRSGVTTAQPRTGSKRDSVAGRWAAKACPAWCTRQIAGREESWGAANAAILRRRGPGVADHVGEGRRHSACRGPSTAATSSVLRPPTKRRRTGEPPEPGCWNALRAGVRCQHGSKEAQPPATGPRRPGRPA